ncbi:MAG: START domain-containing protein [Deltaproteobacteria bacterium]
MIRLPIVACLLLSTPALAERPWTFRVQEDGVAVYNRDVPGSSVKEVRAEGVIDAPPAAVWAMISDVASYPKTMPYVNECLVLEPPTDGRSLVYYSRLGLPIISDRDYVLKVTLEKRPADGPPPYRMSWSSASDPKAPPPKPGVVRLTDVAGDWELEAIRDGKATHAVYFVHLNPQSPLPAFVINKANSQSVPELFQRVREWSKKAPYAQAADAKK